MAALGYDSAMVMIAPTDTMKRCRHDRCHKVRDALAATKEDYHAVTGVITSGANRNASKPAVIYTRNQERRLPIYVETVAP